MVDDHARVALQAASGDTILVGPGTYHEHIFAGDKDLTFLSTAGAEQTVLDGSIAIEGREGSILYSLEDTAGSLVIGGFRLQNGQGSYSWGAISPGGAIYWNDFPRGHGSLKVLSCEFVDNRSGYFGDGMGAAVFARGMNGIEFLSCRFGENLWTGASSGMVMISGIGDFVISQCEFGLTEGGNTALSVSGSAHCRVENCSFEASFAGGDCLWFTSASVTLTDNLFIGRGTGASATRMTFGYSGVPGYEPVQTLNMERNLFWCGACADSIAEPTVFVFFPNQRVVMENNTFVRCGVVTDGGGGTKAQISRNIFYHCRTVFLSWYGGDISCNDIWPGELEVGLGYTLTDNIRAAPFFCDEEGGDLSLAYRSLCASENSPEGCGQIGAFAPACEDTPVESVSWERMKALWRNRR